MSPPLAAGQEALVQLQPVLLDTPGKLPAPSPRRHARGRGYFFSAPIEMINAA